MIGINEKEIETGEFELFHEESITTREKIGEGAFGVVRKAYIVHFGEVAVKKFGIGLVFDDEDRKYTKQELENVVSITHHPNIVRIFGFTLGASNAITGYVMEYMDNGNLHSAIFGKENRLEYGQNLAFGWMIQAARALAFLHNREVIHRDVKPKNMLLRNNYSSLKLCDFGLSRGSNTGKLTTAQGQGNFMAPEVISGSNYTTKIDIFSLAMCIWEICTRKSVQSTETFPPHGIYDYQDPNSRPDLNEVHYEVIFKKLPSLWDQDPANRMTAMEIVDYLSDNMEEDICCPELNRRVLADANTTIVFEEGESYQHFPSQFYGTWNKTSFVDMEKNRPISFPIPTRIEFIEAGNRRCIKCVTKERGYPDHVDFLTFDADWHRAVTCSQRLTLVNYDRFRWEKGELGNVEEDSEWVLKDQIIEQTTYKKDLHTVTIYRKVD